MGSAKKTLRTIFDPTSFAEKISFGFVRGLMTRCSGRWSDWSSIVIQSGLQLKLRRGICVAASYL